jgi:hypothetical protein
MAPEKDPGRWHEDEQKFLEKLEQQCNVYHEHHNKDHLYYQKLASKFNIPILIVSALNALCAISLNDFLAQRYVSILNAVLSAGTGVLGSVQLYMKINEKMTNSVRAATLMKRLALKISKELSIDMEHRVTDGQAFLGDCFAEFNTALEQGNTVEKGLYNHMAFTQLPKKERLGLLGTITGSPRKSSVELVGTEISGSSGMLSRLGEPRAKRLWGLALGAQTDARFHPVSKSPFRQTGSGSSSSPLGTPEELDVELGGQGS